MTGPTGGPSAEAGRPAPADPRLALALWRQREFRLLWTAQVVSTLGSHAVGIVVPLLILALTNSPAQVGLAGALGVIPYLLLVLPVGALIDRWDRRRVMISANLAAAAVALSVPLALWLDALTIGHLYGVALAHGTCGVFFNIAETASLPRVVARPQLPQAVAQNQVGFATAAIAGPALGTWLYQAFGRALPFVVDAASYGASAWALWRMRSDFSPQPNSAALNLRREVMVGLRWVWGQRLVRDLAFLTGCSNFVHAALPLLLILMAQAQGATDSQIGLIFSAAGVGGVLGGLAGPPVQRRFHFGHILFGTLLIEAVVVAVVWLAHGQGLRSPLALGLAFGLVMFVAPIYNVVQFSHRLAMIPDGLQGRVNSAYRLVAHALQPVGAALCGLLVEHWGLLPALALFVAVFFAVAAAARLDPAIWREGRAGAGAASPSPG